MKENYVIRNIPDNIRNKIEELKKVKKISIRVIILEALDRYISSLDIKRN